MLFLLIFPFYSKNQNVMKMTDVQSNSVITNSTGPSIFVRYNRDIVITVKLYVVKSPFGTENFLNFVRYSREFVIAVNSL
jgi:hypothetical protein